jgi:hypothetical protein
MEPCVRGHRRPVEGGHAGKEAYPRWDENEGARVEWMNGCIYQDSSDSLTIIVDENVASVVAVTFWCSHFGRLFHKTKSCEVCHGSPVYPCLTRLSVWTQLQPTALAHCLLCSRQIDGLSRGIKGRQSTQFMVTVLVTVRSRFWSRSHI